MCCVLEFVDWLTRNTHIQQLAAKDAELEALKSKLAELQKQVAIAGSNNDELKKLREQLVAIREERDKLSKEVAKQAAAQAEPEANKAQCLSLQAALNDANEELDALRRKLSETEKKLAESEAGGDIVIQKTGPTKAAKAAAPGGGGVGMSSASLKRAIELTNLAAELVAKDHYFDHRVLAGAAQGTFPLHQIWHCSVERDVVRKNWLSLFFLCNVFHT
jgi:myosin heavy subunit